MTWSCCSVVLSSVVSWSTQELACTNACSWASLWHFLATTWQYPGFVRGRGKQFISVEGSFFMGEVIATCVISLSVLWTWLHLEIRYFQSIYGISEKQLHSSGLIDYVLTPLSCQSRAAFSQSLVIGASAKTFSRSFRTRCVQTSKKKHGNCFKMQTKWPKANETSGVGWRVLLPLLPFDGPECPSTSLVIG